MLSGMALLACGLLAACGSTTSSEASAAAEPAGAPSPSRVIAVDGPTYDSLSALAERASSVAVIRFAELMGSTTDGQIGGLSEASGLPVQVWTVVTEEPVAGEVTPQSFRLAILDPTSVSSHQEPVAVGDRRVGFVYPVTVGGVTTYFVAGLGQGLVPVTVDGALMATGSASPSLVSDISRVGSVAALRAEIGG